MTMICQACKHDLPESEFWRNSPTTFKKKCKRCLGKRPQWKTYEEAKALMKLFNIRTIEEFNRVKHSKSFPKDIPKNPYFVYQTEWTTFGDFFGTGRIANQCRDFYSYQEAKQFLKNKGLTTKRSYQIWLKKNKEPKLHTDPLNYYKEDWKGWKDFLTA